MSDAAIGKKIKPPLWFGGVASAMAACCTHPLDLVKVRLQTSHSNQSLIKTGADIIRKESLFALFNGLSASILRQLTYSTTRFGMYEGIKREMTKDGQAFTPLKAISAGIISGAFAGTLGNPADVVNVRMQNDGKLPLAERRNYKHALDGLLRILKDEGISKLFVGVTANMSRAIILTTGQLTSYDWSKQTLLNSGLFHDNIITHFGASFMAGFVATTISSPVDVIKTRLMSSKAPIPQGNVVGIADGVASASLNTATCSSPQKASSLAYNGVFDAIVRISREEGLSAFFRGWVPSFTRLAPQTILTFVILEKMKHYYRALVVRNE